MLRVGLTGGIACGKSTVSRLFAELGAPVVDADVIARELVAPGQPVLAEIERRFGPGLLKTSGELDRARLRTLIFSDPEKKRQLEALLHPLVYEKIDRDVARLSAPYAIISVPLLIETGGHDNVDRVLVVTCSEAEQRRRLWRRDGIDPILADKIIANQATPAERLAVADEVIDNQQPIDRLAVTVKKLDNFYLTLAARDFL